MPVTTMTSMPVEKLTEATLSGNGVFDVLMRATKAHLDEEYNKNRIRGQEYSQVYLGSLAAVMEHSLRFLLEKDKSALEASLIDAQVRLAESQILLVQKQIDDRIASGVDPQQAQQDLLAEKQPSHAFVTPQHLGELVLFLCSEAGSQVRGAAWNIDGGWLAQ